MKTKLSILISSALLMGGCMAQPKNENNNKNENIIGKELFISKCTVCHSATMPKSSAEKDALVAPAIFGVMNHMRMEFGNDKKAMGDFMKDYIMNPSQEKALCQKEKIKKFGLMPSQKGTLTQKELSDIVDYLTNM